MLKNFVPVAYEEVLSFFIGKKFALDREVSLVTSSVLTMLTPTPDKEVSLLTSFMLVPPSDREVSLLTSSMLIPSDREVSLLTSSMLIPEWVCYPGNTSYRTRSKFGSSRAET